MAFDQAQSHRIGQRIPDAGAPVRIVDDVADVEAPYLGQLVYDGASLQLWDGTVWVAV